MSDCMLEEYRRSYGEADHIQINGKFAKKLLLFDGFVLVVWILFSKLAFYYSIGFNGNCDTRPILKITLQQE